MLAEFDEADRLEALIREHLAVSQWLSGSTFPLAIFANGSLAEEPLAVDDHFFGGSIPWVKTKELVNRWVESTEESITELED